jgi:hypothetical protein
VGVSWPVTFLSKWILGNAQYFYDLANYSAYEDMSNSFYSDFGRNSFEQDILLFTEVPLLQAVYCSPIIETADANITVDITNGRVQSYRILNDPERSDSPWLDVFVHHQNISSDCEFDVGCGDGPGVLYPNVTNRLVRQSPDCIGHND